MRYGTLALCTFFFGMGTTASQAQINGFSTSTFTLNHKNGNPSISGSVLTLTTNTTFEATSAFNNNKQTISTFNSKFLYTPSGNKAGDGFALVLQNDPAGINALGGYGGYLGYHAGGGSSGIAKGVALEFNLYSSYTVGTTLRTDGTASTIGPYTSTSPVSLTSGDPIQVTLAYNGTTLTESLLDTTTSSTYSTTYAINIANTVGGSTAYIGFTGGTGSAVATQTISKFTFNYTPAAATPEPGSMALLIGLGISGAGFLVRRNRK